MRAALSELSGHYKKLTKEGTGGLEGDVLGGDQERAGGSKWQRT